MATRIPITKDSFGFENRQDDIWKKMEDDMERRRKEWENEIEKMSTDFFSLRPDRPAGRFEPMADRLGIAESYDDGKSVIEKNEHGHPVFKARFNVKDYKPEEVNVKMDSNKIIVQAKHEENSGGASVSREYSREVNIPREIDPMALQCTISQGGVLTVEAPLPTPDHLNDSPGSADKPGLSQTPPPVPAPDYMNDRPGSAGKYGISQSSNSPHHSGTSSPASFQQQRVSTPPSYKPQPVHVTSTPVTHSQQFQSPPSSGQFQSTPSSGQYQQSTSGGSFSNPGNSGQFQPPPYQSQGQSFVKAQPAFNETSQNSSSTSSTQQTAAPTTVAGKTFKIETDIEDFSPEDLTVKTVDKKIMITARKEEKRGNRTSTREMTREFHIPENVDPYTVKAFFTDAGKLILEAPYRRSAAGPHTNGGPNVTTSIMTGR